jgi:hypothetical protein
MFERIKIKLLIGIAVASIAAIAPLARAQYIPIPDYVGVQAGKQFRTDINNHLSGVSAIAPRLVSLPFASLPAEADGQEYWCPNCAQTTPSTAGGAGALALGQAGQWACSATGTASITPPAGDICGTISNPTACGAHWSIQTCSASPCTVTAAEVLCNAAAARIFRWGMGGDAARDGKHGSWRGDGGQPIHELDRQYGGHSGGRERAGGRPWRQNHVVAIALRRNLGNFDHDAGNLDRRRERWV